ncbi:replicative DNA helicase [Patescibacteria group bacterium]|nr:replicative DNA helicase [Patescibacteria group bacterium]
MPQIPTNDLEKIQPQSLEAEMSLIGSILLDKDTMLRVADIVAGSGDFYKDAHKKIFETILDLYANNEPIDLLTLSNRLEEKNMLESVGGRSYLVSITNAVPTASNAANYAHIVHRKAVRRRLLSASHEISRLGYEENDDLEKVLDEAQQHLFGVSENYFRQAFTPIRGILADAFDRIDELHKNKGQLRGLPTSFTGLDNLLAGLQKSDLIILAARPSVGKTSLAMDIVRNVGVRQKVPVAMFSLEMSKEQLVDRMLCAEANVDLWKMRTGRLSDRPEDDDFPRIGHAIGTLSEAPIFIDDSSNCNILQIRTKARRLQSEHGLGLIVIDYLQLMESRGQENRVQEVAEITRGLKSIARELNIPVVALSQLSRVVEQSKPAIPKLSHLRESGSIEQDADVVMFIYRKAADRNYRIEDVPPDERYVAEIHIAKHRNGPTGVVKLIFHEPTTSFRNMDTQFVNTAQPQGSGSDSQPNATQTLKPKTAFAKPQGQGSASPEVPAF